ncbi:hypothetical protein [Streptomyces sp. NPDC097610]|uniref:hypothetical protein n=1 Tax=Streptomyces sp. NPDC097610 TaxID=3157227 RepID=UPI0033276333
MGSLQAGTSRARVHLRAARGPGPAAAGTVVFVAATVVLVLGRVTGAMELYVVATASWAGVAAVAFFRV